MRLIDADALLEAFIQQYRFGALPSIYDLITNAPAIEQKPWVGLSDSEVMEITWDLEDTDDLDIFTSDFARAIEAKLKQLNMKGLL